MKPLIIYDHIGNTSTVDATPGRRVHVKSDCESMCYTVEQSRALRKALKAAEREIRARQA